MKSIIFVVSSIAIVGIYMLVVGLFTNPTGRLTTLENMIQFWIPTALIVNAVIVAPMVMRKKLDDKARKLLSQVLVIISLIIARASHTWAIVISWYVTTLVFIAFFITSLIVILFEKTLKTKNELNLFSNYVLPFFTIGLIIWSFFIIHNAIFMW